MLNREQVDASTLDAKYALILAGPGTGKTTALVGRFAHLVKNGAEPNSILCCTFAKKAADELGSRIQLATGINARGLSIGTFHALAFRLVKSHGKMIGITAPESVLLEKDRLNAIFEIKKRVDAEKLYKDFNKESSRPSVILKFIDEARESLLDPEDASVEASESGKILDTIHAEIYAHYENWLTQFNKIDFPRMIQFACKILAHDSKSGCKIGASYTHILVDEYQDINKAQKTMVDELLKGGASLWVVGDDDQAIYGWRGSSSKFILDFDKFYPGTKKINLVQNYRSGKEIVANATDLVNNISRRHKKNLVSNSDSPSNVVIVRCKNEKEEAEKVTDTIKQRLRSGVAVENIAVLSRTNVLPSTVIDNLIAEEIPVVLKDGIQLFAETVAQDLVSAVAIACNKKSEKGWDRRLPRNIQSFAEKISKDEWSKKVKALATMLVKHSPPSLSDDDLGSRIASIDYYKEYLLSFDDEDEVFRRIRGSMQQPRDKRGIYVGTIHRAKGLEWDSVFVIGWEDDLLPHALNHGFKGIDEERRLAYVAVTRPKKYLMMSYVQFRQGDEKKYSRFLDEMPDAMDVDLEARTKETASQPIKKRVAKIQDPLAAITKKYEKQIRAFETHEELVARHKAEAMRQDESAKARKTDAEKKSGDATKEEDRAFYREINEIIAQKKLSKNVADGSGLSMVGSIEADDGFLRDAGYNAKKDGPSTAERHTILTKVFAGEIEIPDGLKESVVEQWAEPNSVERLQKMRNAINFSLGTQKGRSVPSEQAIEKWEADLVFLDELDGNFSQS